MQVMIKHYCFQLKMSDLKLFLLSAGVAAPVHFCMENSPHLLIAPSIFLQIFLSFRSPYKILTFGRLFSGILIYHSVLFR